MLHKKFVSDHLAKTLKKNHGEIPMYYAENTHKPIVEKSVFDKTNQILEESRKKVRSSGKPNNIYPFTSKIRCLNCGKNYKIKIYRGDAYWNCITYLEEGKNKCFSKRISEEILMSKTCEVLDISDFNEDLFKEKIKQILVPKQEHFTFVFYDGKEVEVTWKNPPRSES